MFWLQRLWYSCNGCGTVVTVVVQLQWLWYSCKGCGTVATVVVQLQGCGTVAKVAVQLHWYDTYYSPVGFGL